MLTTALSLLLVSIAAAIPPAVILGLIVCVFDETAGLYTGMAVFVWKLCEYLRIALSCIQGNDDEA